MPKNLKRVGTLTFKFYIMKRNLLALFAVILAIGFSAFTTKKTDVLKPAKKGAATRYYQFSTTATDQKVFANYTDLGTTLPSDCPNTLKLCWIAVPDENNDNVIDGTDFTTAFNALDVNGNGTLNDETEDNINFSKRATGH